MSENITLLRVFNYTWIGAATVKENITFLHVFSYSSNCTGTVRVTYYTFETSYQRLATVFTDHRCITVLTD